MMMKDDKKNMATLIVRRMKDGSESTQKRPQHEGAEMGETDELTMMADDVMTALDKKDVRAFADSMKAFIEHLIL